MIFTLLLNTLIFITLHIIYIQIINLVVLPKKEDLALLVNFSNVRWIFRKFSFNYY